MHGYYITLGRIALYLSYSAGKHPWMETTKGLVATFFQYYLNHNVSTNGFFSEARSLRYISRHTQASVAAYLH